MYDEITEVIEPTYQISVETINPYELRKDIVAAFNRGEIHTAENGLQSQAGTHDIQALNRAIYHKIQNEVSLLGIIARRLATKNPDNKTLAAIVEDITYISIGITERRDTEKARIQVVPVDNYRHVVEAISQTAHDIADFVNNELAVVRMRVQRTIRKQPTDDPSQTKLEKLLQQIIYTETALNDLKSINEGITLKMTNFQIKELFESWQATPELNNATLEITMSNGDNWFVGDMLKIRSFISELIENALKYNPDQPDLTIQLTTQDVDGLPAPIMGLTSQRYRKITSEKRYLNLTVSDNGQGVSDDKKKWIFLPLHSTSNESGGGVGLFIIFRTLKEMRGYIIETGTHGAKFEIYIPYIERGVAS
ncbi:ATP-binding protein [Anaerolineales bacterium HSG24]|nr:ATP-binding protein [Anaerolineales bacterium HSG24]